MTKQLKHFSIFQTSKVFALLYLIVSAIICFPLGIFIYMKQHDSLELYTMLATPFVYGIGSFILTAFSCWIYNFIAKYVGGIEFTVVEKTPDNH